MRGFAASSSFAARRFVRAIRYAGPEAEAAFCTAGRRAGGAESKPVGTSYGTSSRRSLSTGPKRTGLRGTKPRERGSGDPCNTCGAGGFLEARGSRWHATALVAPGSEFSQRPQRLFRVALSGFSVERDRPSTREFCRRRRAGQGPKLPRTAPVLDVLHFSHKVSRVWVYCFALSQGSSG